MKAHVCIYVWYGLRTAGPIYRNFADNVRLTELVILSSLLAIDRQFQTDRQIFVLPDRSRGHSFYF